MRANNIYYYQELNDLLSFMEIEAKEFKLNFDIDFNNLMM